MVSPSLASDTMFHKIDQFYQIKINRYQNFLCN